MAADSQGDKPPDKWKAPRDEARGNPTSEVEAAAISDCTATSAVNQVRFPILTRHWGLEDVAP
jgi:hypothetical protein